ncbi:MAG: MFS transporter [Vampirovibrionales bacterium]|nr:MFS transporter [Vampirovibrionales bacterium]
MTAPASQPSLLPVAHTSLWTPSFVLLCGVLLTFFISYHLLLPVIPAYLKTHHVSASTIGLLLSSFAVASLASRPFAGYWVDRFQAPRLVMAGTLLFTVTTAFYTLVSPQWLNGMGWLPLRLLQGLAFAVVYTGASRWLILLTPTKRKAEAMGIFGNIMKLAMALAPPAGIWLWSQQSKGIAANPYLWATLTGALALLWVMLLIRYTQQTNHETSQSGSSGALTATPVTFQWNRLIHPKACTPGALMTTSSLVYGALIPFVPQLASELLPTATTSTDIGWFYTVYAVTLIASRGLTGPLSDQWASRWGRLVVALPGMLLVGVAILWLQQTHSLLPFLAATGLYGLAAGSVQPALMAIASDKAEPERQGAAMATFSMLNDSGIALGMFWMGWAGPTLGYATALWGVSAIVLLGVVVGLALCLQENRSSTPLRSSCIA